MLYTLPPMSTPDAHDADRKLRRAVKAARRILVLGSPGSGKTTLSIALARALSVEHIELDDHFWETPTRWMSRQAWHPYVLRLAAADEWLIDGTYESTLELRLARAQLAIVIEASRATCLRRVVQRRLTLKIRGRRELAPGQHLDRRFLTYVWRYPQSVRPFVWQALQDRRDTMTIVRLSSGAGIRALMRHVS